MTLRNTLGTAVAGAALLVMAGSGTAQATPAYAYAEMQFVNFQLTFIGTVGLVGFTVQGQESTNMTGFAPTAVTTTGDVTSGVTSPPGYSGPLGSSFGAAGLTAGDALGNGWGQQLLVGAGAQAQQLISGPIGGAQSYQVSEAHLTSGPSAAGATTNSNTVLSVVVNANPGDQVRLTTTGHAILHALFGQTGDLANASASASYTIVDTTSGAPTEGDLVFSDAPARLNNPFTSLQALTPGVARNYDSGDVVINDLYTFVTTGTFSITLFDNTAANVSTVPEPVSLALLGSGLVALGVIRRRRNT